MPDGPGDVEIESMLRAAPAERWAELRASMAAWRASREPSATWPEWKPIGQTDDGQPIYEWPHPQYSEAVDRVVDALRRLGVVVVFDWVAADLPARYPGGAGLADAPVAEAARMATSIIRAERFTDGAIESAIEQGYVDAVVDRLLAFADQQG